VSGTRYYTPSAFEIDQNGVPLAGAQLFFYQTGEPGTFQNTYQDAALSVPNENPVRADANGRFGSIFLIPSPAYNVQLWTAPTTLNPSGVEVWSYDPVGPGTGGAPQQTAGMVGEIRMFAGPATAVPSGWYLCYGQTLSQATYSALYAVIGTTWNTGGEPSGSFRLPDLRGRGLFGLDNMGGSAANRVTSGVSGVPGATLGGTGGSQAVQTHAHSLSDPTHDHALTDPGHVHAAASGGQFVVYIGSGGNANIVSGTQALGFTDTAAAETGITIASADTGITMVNYGAGGSQNMPPAAMVNAIIYAGV